MFIAGINVLVFQREGSSLDYFLFFDGKHEETLEGRVFVALFHCCF